MKKILLFLILLFSFGNVSAGIVGKYNDPEYTSLYFFGSYVVDKGNDINIIKPYFTQGGSNYYEGINTLGSNGKIITYYNSIASINYENKNFYVFSNSFNQKKIFISFYLTNVGYETRNLMRILIYDNDTKNYIDLGKSLCNKNILNLKGFMYGNILTTSCGIIDTINNTFTPGPLNDTGRLEFNSNYYYRFGLNSITYLNEDNKSYDGFYWSDDSQSFLSTSNGFVTVESFDGYNYFSSETGAILSTFGSGDFRTYNPYDGGVSLAGLGSINEYYTNSNNGNLYKIIGNVNPLIDEFYTRSTHQVLFFPYINSGNNFLWYVDSVGNIYNDTTANLDTYIGTIEDGGGGSDGGDNCSIFDYNCDGEVGILDGEFLLGLGSWLLTPVNTIWDYIIKIKEFIGSFQDIFTTETRTIGFFDFIPNANAEFNPLNNLPSSENKNFMTDIFAFGKAFVVLIFLILGIVAFIKLNKNKNE